MPGFASIDDMVTEITTNAKRSTIPFTRVIQTGATSVAGRWHDMLQGIGTGGTMVLTGTAGVGIAKTSADAGCLPLVPTTVTTDLRFLLSMMAVTSGATVVPALLMLTDILYIYPTVVVTGTPTALNNGAAKPTRFGGGAGVMASATVVTTAIGAAAPILTVTYTNSTPTGSRTGSFATPIATGYPTGACMVGSATASILGGPFMTMAAGDSGVSQLDSYTLAGGTTGTVTFILHKPIAFIPLTAVNVAGERDFIFQLPSFPKIEDSACLGFFILIGGATTANQIVTGSLTLGWG